MKNSLLILGITLVSLTNVCNATNRVGRSVSIFEEDILTKENIGLGSTEKVKMLKPYLNKDLEVFNPETVIEFSRKTIKETISEADEIIEETTSNDLEFLFYEKSMKDLIAHSDLIIENTVSDEAAPLYGERTLEEVIVELEKIIESTETNEVRPLDFKKINSNSLLITTFDSEKFIGMN